MQIVPSIRIATTKDALGIQQIYAPVVLETPITFEIDVPTEAEFAERIEKTLIQFPWLVYEIDNVVAGYAYANAYRLRPAYQWSAEISIYVNRNFHGRGIGKALYQSLFAILDKQGYYTLVAGITLPNQSSVAIHESLGFKPIGAFTSLGYKLGAWHDVGFWQLALKMATCAEPAPPIAFSQMIG